MNRGILEVTGRVLRTVNARKEVFEELMALDSYPKKWNYQKLIQQRKVYEKAQYVQNIKEHTINFVAKNGRMPKDFFELQKPPIPKKAILSYAPDDGQAIQMQPKENEVEIRIKVFVPEDTTDAEQEEKQKQARKQSRKKKQARKRRKSGQKKQKQGEKESPEGKWEWMTFFLPLPSHLQNQPIAAPDLRLACIHGEWMPVLDYKIKKQCPDTPKQSEYFLCVDWGVRKLITVCVFDTKGNQITQPIFLQFQPIRSKLLRIRNEIDRLKSRRDKQHKNSSKWKKYNREIAKLWRKFRAIGKTLSHLAASVIILIAQMYDCSEIYVEWLKSLKSKKQNHQLNWIINTTVRQAICQKVFYKARLAGINLRKPLPPGYTSQYCPRCANKGLHAKSPNHEPEDKSNGGWFVCPNCKFNADRDYVACCNLARKALYGNSLKKLSSKGIVSYKKTPISDPPLRQTDCIAVLYKCNCPIISKAGEICVPCTQTCLSANAIMRQR